MKDKAGPGNIGRIVCGGSAEKRPEKGQKKREILQDSPFQRMAYVTTKQPITIITNVCTYVNKK